jgi:DNA polymerase-3 subunit epsilon
VNWWRRWLGARVALDEPRRVRRDALLDAPCLDTAAPLSTARFVVADVESTGLDVFNDRLIAIGAVSVEGGCLQLAPVFYRVLRQRAPSSIDNILVHGIGGAEQTGGEEPADVLLDFMTYAGAAPLVGFHADFDRTLVNRASREYLGVTPRNVWLDLARLAPALAPDEAGKRRALDDWTSLFGIENAERHHALADAAATAQLLLVLLARAQTQGMQRVEDLVRLEKDQRWLAR